MRKVLITGGMGFIGPAMVRRFMESSRVTVADRLDYGIAPQMEPFLKEGRLELLETDLAILSPLYQRIEAGEFDVIVHLAAFAFIPACEAYPDFAYQSNLLPTLNLLSKVPSGCRLILFSTSATYAPETKSHEEESSTQQAIDIYGWSKLHGEDLARHYSRRRGLSVLLIRLANAAGYGETNPRILETILRQIHEGKTVVELGNLSPRRDYIHIDDVAWVVEQLSCRWSFPEGTVEALNVGTGYPPISVEELFQKVVACTGKDIRLKSVRERQRQEDREHLYVNCKKLFSILPDFKPKRIEEWLPALVRDPGLRDQSRLHQMIEKRYGKE